MLGGEMAEPRFGIGAGLASWLWGLGGALCVEGEASVWAEQQLAPCLGKDSSKDQ